MNQTGTVTLFQGRL